MAGRFLLRKLSSSMSRSTSLLGASAAAREPVSRRARESGIRNLLYLFSGASGHCSKVAPNLPGTHTHAARYLNTLPCASAASGAGSQAIGMPSAVTWKPASVNSVGSKRTFSSSTSTNDAISAKPEVPTSIAEWEADFAAWKTKQDMEIAAFCRELAAFGRYISCLLGSWGLFLGSWCAMKYSESSHANQSNYKVQSGSRCCSSSSKCLSMD